MFGKLESPWNYIVMVLTFPLLFQKDLWKFAWGAQDELYIMLAKRVFLLLPSLAIIFSCWITIICTISIVFRAERREFVQAIFVTWWDLGRAIFSFWAGILKFVISLFGWLYAFIKVVLMGLVLSIKDIVFLPFRLIADVSSDSFKKGIPWPAIFLMMVWTLIEALIFTFVMTPLVVDVMDGFSDGEFEASIGLKVVLYLMFSLFVLGSYAVIHTLGEAFRQKDIPKIIMYTIVEMIVAIVETVLFYKEFVDALIPWFAQYAGDDFDLGIVGILSVAFFIWLGIRCMTWFLFGSSAIPNLLAVIQRTGLEGYEKGSKVSSGAAARADLKEIFAQVNQAIEVFKSDMDWLESKVDAVFSSFIIPPLQIVAASINFCTLLLSGRHLFELPFSSYKDLLKARELVAQVRKNVHKE